MKKYNLKLHISSSESIAFLFNTQGQILARQNQSFSSQYDDIYGRVYDPLEIIYSVRSSIHELFQRPEWNINHIDSISIICQSFGMVVWEKTTGLAVSPLLYYDKERVKYQLNQFHHGKKLDLYQDQIQQQLYPHCLAIHLAWLRQCDSEVEKLIQKKQVWVSGVASWLLYNLSGVDDVSTDYSSAMTTYLFDTKKLDWSSFMLEEFNIPKHILPTCKPSFSQFGVTKGFIPLPDGIPINSMITDHASRWNYLIQPEFGDIDICFTKHNIKITVNVGHDKDFIDKIKTTTLLPNKKTTYLALEHYIPYLSWPESVIQGSLKEFLQTTLTEPRPSSRKLFIIPAKTNITSQESSVHLIGLNNDVTSSDIAEAYLEALFYNIKYDLHLIEKTYDLPLKHVLVTSDYDVSDLFLENFSNTLQMPFSFAKKVDLEVFASFFQHHSALTAKDRSKLLKHFPDMLQHIVPSTDPISTFAAFNTWVTTQTQYGSLTTI